MGILVKYLEDHPGWNLGQGLKISVCQEFRKILDEPKRMEVRFYLCSAGRLPWVWRLEQAVKLEVRQQIEGDSQ